MAGTWLSIVHGFGGLRIKEDKLMLAPKIPDNWQEYSFKLCFRDRTLEVTVNKECAEIELINGSSINIIVNATLYNVSSKTKVELL